MAEPPPSEPSRRALILWGRDRLEAEAYENPRQVAEWLLMDVLDVGRVALVAHPGVSVPTPDVERFRAMIDRCAAGEPMQHVLGADTFYGLELTITPDVLVPRPETEELVERLLDLLADVPAPRVLDVGTGSGCIALALQHERPDAVVHACDVSADALAVAQRNAHRLDLTLHLSEVDVLADDAAALLPGDLDALVSNPPYIPNDEAASLPATVRDYDPPVALFSGDDPLRFYRALASLAPTLCVPVGLCIVEAHADYADDVGALFRAEGLTDVHVETDLAGRPRIVWARVPDAD
jgi:release factor glutamine methyltransferase